MKTDFFGNEIKVGDIVAFMQIGYRNLLKGKVTKLTDKMVFIEHLKTNIGQTETKQEYRQVIVAILKNNPVGLSFPDSNNKIHLI